MRPAAPETLDICFPPCTSALYGEHLAIDSAILRLRILDFVVLKVATLVIPAVGIAEPVNIDTFLLLGLHALSTLLD